MNIVYVSFQTAHPFLSTIAKAPTNPNPAPRNTFPKLPQVAQIAAAQLPIVLALMSRNSQQRGPRLCPSVRGRAADPNGWDVSNKWNTKFGQPCKCNTWPSLDSTCEVTNK